MNRRVLSIASGLLLVAAMPAFVGCASTSHGASISPKRCGTRVATHTETKTEKASVSLAMADLPPNAVAGECYAKVFVPAKVQTVSERVCVKPATETCEIIPAQYEWVEERVCVKDACKDWREVAPAQFKAETRMVEVEPGYKGWVHVEGGLCKAESEKPLRDVYCFVDRPPVEKSVEAESLMKAAQFEEVTVPAQYETVRRQKLVCPATTRKVAIPAEYQTIEKQVIVDAGRWEWQRVVCEIDPTDMPPDGHTDTMADRGNVEQYAGES